jgi:hypothetical protein
MNTRNRNLFVTFGFIVLITACSNEPKIKSATEDKVVVGASAEQFLDAFDLAKKECEKNTRTAHYIPDDNVDMEIVSFNCVGQEEEVVAEAEADTGTAMEAEPVMDEEATPEMEPQIETEIEEAEVELDAGETSTQ